LEERSHPEGPFGEFTGYYTWYHERAPVIVVKRVMWRNDPILLGAPPMQPPTGERLYDYLHTAQLWQRMEERETPGLVAVWIMPAGVSGYLTVIAIKQQYEGHARDVASIATQTGGLGRFVIVVDDDVDPSNEQEVLWALATRCEPQDAVQIVSNCRSAVLDPLIPRENKSIAKELRSSRGVLIACRPYSWRDHFPLVNRFSEEKRKAALEKWARYL
ncbi:MAG: UbiD family decarboxylase, partial [Deltaproteobacteria bacterium]|nr:UbiD family decarboxylase [Deltaproteobacteria bacterium]